MADAADEDLQDIRRDLLADRCERRSFEHNGRELVIREMNMAEYSDFADLSTRNAEDFVPFVIDMVTLPDGRSAFTDEHVDTLLELPHTGSVVGKIQHHFMRVNGFITEDDEDDELTADEVRTLAMAAEDDEDLGAAIRERIELDEEDEGKSTSSEDG